MFGMPGFAADNQEKAMDSIDLYSDRWYLTDIQR